MTDQQAQRIYDAMLELWPDTLPNLEHEPRRFAYYVKMFKYCHPNRMEECMSEQ